MSFRLDQLLKASTVRVSSSGKAYDGMGFFFAPGLALTSAYVVSQPEGQVVQVYLPGEKHAVPAEVKYRFPEEVGLVILQVQTTEMMPCVYLDADIKPGDKGYTFGCTATARTMHRVMVECDGMINGEIGILNQAGRSRSLRMNGAPILNQRTGKVCGIYHSNGKRAPHSGEAVPMGIVFSEFPALTVLQKEYHCQDSRWITMLHPDLEAMDADWSYYNRGWMRREQSVKSLMFLLKTAAQWSLIGARMPHAFPWRSLIALIKNAFRGTLGDEMQRQYLQITRQLVTNIAPNATNQARVLHRVDAQSWVLSQLMEQLITPEQDYASQSRLLWMLEILQEQRVYIQTMKRMPGNFYPKLEGFKRQWNLLEYDDKYIDTDRVLTGLVNRNTDTNFALWYTLKFFLKDFLVELSKNSKLSSHGLERLFDVLVSNLKRAVPMPPATIEDLLRDLDEEVRRNPELKALQKVQILMHTVSGELIQGGQYRAWKGSNTYHFSRKCKLYPERAQGEDLNRVICYDTEEEAAKHHKPCKNCMMAEKMMNRRIADWGDGEATEAIGKTHIVEPTLPNLPVAGLDHGLNTGLDNMIQLPVVDRTISEAPAADAPVIGFAEAFTDQAAVHHDLDAINLDGDTVAIETSDVDAVSFNVDPVSSNVDAISDDLIPADLDLAALNMTEDEAELPEITSELAIDDDDDDSEMGIYGPETLEKILAADANAVADLAVADLNGNAAIADPNEAAVAISTATVQELPAPELPTLAEDITAIQAEADIAIQVTPVVESTAEREFDLSAFVLTQDEPAVAATSDTTAKKTRKTSKNKAAKVAAATSAVVTEVTDVPTSEAEVAAPIATAAVNAPKPARRKTTKANSATEVAVNTDSETGAETGVAAATEATTEATTAVDLAHEVQLAQPATTRRITQRKKTTAKTQSLNGFSAIMAAYADTVLDEPEANATVVNKTKAKATSKTTAKTITKTTESAATESAKVTVAEPKSKATKSKSKVTRMADWANDAAAVTEPVNEKSEAIVVPITEAKSARRKHGKSTSKTHI